MVDEKRIQNIVNKTVEKAIQGIAREEKISVLAATHRFKRSKTYDMLLASETGMWQESVEYILYEYKSEQTKAAKEKKRTQIPVHARRIQACRKLRKTNVLADRLVAITHTGRRGKQKKIAAKNYTERIATVIHSIGKGNL